MKLQLHRHRNLLAGFFVSTAAITFLVSLAVLLAHKGVFELRYTIAAVFDSGVGLRPGADVLFNGVQIGQVESLNLLGHGGADVFVHISAVEKAGLRGLNEGQRVSYELQNERGKTAAVNLKAL